jgi:hypothetical protein
LLPKLLDPAHTCVEFLTREPIEMVLLQRLPPDEVARILRLPSVLGRDLINQFRFTCDYQAGIVELSRP